MAGNVTRADLEAMSAVPVLQCMRCGKCTGTCPSYDNMEYHPHEFVYMVERGEIDKLLESDSIYRCMSCFACVDRCPRQVRPAVLIEAVRNAAERRQNANHLNANDVPPVTEADPDLPQQALMSAFRKYRK